MNKQDFICEAVLRMIQLKEPVNTSEVIKCATLLADQIFPDEKKTDEKKEETSYDRPISIIVEKMRDLAPGRYATRLNNNFIFLDIHTIDDLLKMGSGQFILKSENIGKKSLRVLDKAIESVIGLKNW